MLAVGYFPSLGPERKPGSGLRSDPWGPSGGRPRRAPARCRRSRMSEESGCFRLYEPGLARLGVESRWFGIPVHLGRRAGLAFSYVERVRVFSQGPISNSQRCFVSSCRARCGWLSALRVTRRRMRSRRFRRRAGEFRAAIRNRRGHRTHFHGFTLTPRGAVEHALLRRRATADWGTGGRRKRDQEE